MANNNAAYLHYIMYLRKSRQDDPHETVEEVLEKHEAILQEFAERELGGRIPTECIYREIGSGESIDDRVAIKDVMAKIEDPTIMGVLAMEPSRLSRGDLSDCARIIDAFRFTHTLVTTPYMTYDLEKKMERKFFQDELLRGNDYLEYTKEILFRGRVASVKRGCYIGSRPPLGYNRVKKGKDWTLEPNADADLVRMIFDWYVNEGISPGAIARRLDSLGYKPSRGQKWARDTIRDMLENVHYIGKVKFNDVKATWVIEDGVRRKKHVKQAAEDVIIAEGKHDGIVDLALFEAAQAKLNSNPRVKNDRELVNVLAGILRCKKCGYIMNVQNKDTALARFTCRLRPYCYKSAKCEEVLDAIVFALKESELPKLQAKLENGDGNAATIQKRRIAQLAKQMEEYRDQEDNQYELLETGKYTQEVFDRRNASLRAKMEECEKQLHLARSALPKNIDYAEKIVSLERAIEALQDDDMPIKEKNRILRAIIDRIDYSSEDKGFNKTEMHLEIFLRL